MSETNPSLNDAFRHHAWATRELMAFSRRLRPEQLSQPQPAPLAGVHGSIAETFRHIVFSDASYLGALTGHRPAWAVSEEAVSSDLADLAMRVDEAEALWLEFLAGPDEGARTVYLDKGTYETRAAIVTAQALHHGNAHREQVCAILRNFGLEPPEVQPWDFADATGRSRWIKPD